MGLKTNLLKRLIFTFMFFFLSDSLLILFLVWLSGAWALVHGMELWLHAEHTAGLWCCAYRLLTSMEFRYGWISL